MSVAPTIAPPSSSPLDAIGAWPADRPLVALHSGQRHRLWGCTSVLAEPRGWFRHVAGRSALIGDLPAGVSDAALSDDPIIDLDRILAASPEGFGWVGSFGYELGAIVEPAAVAATRRPVQDRTAPLIELAWCPAAYVHDHAGGCWTTIGGPDVEFSDGPSDDHCACDAEAMTVSLTPDDYLAAVRGVIEYIRAGDVFQANLTRRIAMPFAGSTRTLARRALSGSGARYGAYIEAPGDRAIVSMSPELFLQVDPVTRSIVTRPIKGTRPAGAARRELLGSGKDAAELHMIIDLMRNDLGRVCVPGTVQVPSGRRIERHPTVLHGVGTVRGHLRKDVSIGEVIAAAFPPGSVTGAPKIRAMQIIEELEPVCRGTYCGAIGRLGGRGECHLNVAIRTMTLHGTRPAGRHDVLHGTLDYGAGGGIVADSTPLEEYREMQAKCAVLWAVTGTAAPRGGEMPGARAS